MTGERFALPEAVAVPGDPGQVALCAVQVNGGGFVLDLRRIREIMRPQRITPVPTAPAHVEGIVHLRGAVIPVVDLRKRLGVAVPADGPLSRLLVAWVGRRQVGLIVDRVDGVLRVPRSKLLPAPDLWLEKGARLFLGVCGEGSDLKLLLNLKALLAVPEAESRDAVEWVRAHAGEVGE